MKNSTENLLDRKETLNVIATIGIWPKAKLGKTSNDDLFWLLQILEILSGGENKRTMAATLEIYRNGYEDTASHSGRLSKCNGDEVALILASQMPQAVIRCAEILAGMDKGELWAKYQYMNAGQQRMNSGNRIRAGVRRGDFTAKDVEEAMMTALKGK